MLHRVPLFLLATLAPAQDTPLRELPYTPSLDLTAIDKSVNPCENLYQFACGGWIKKNPIPPDQGGWDVYAKLTADNERYLWGLLDTAAKPSPNRSAIERQTGDFFSACMDEPLAQKLAATPIQPMLDRIAAMKSVREIAAFAGRHHRDWVNRGLLFNPSSDPDFDDSSKVIAFLNGGGLGLPDRDYYLKEDAKSKELLQAYKAHLERIFALIGESADQARASAAAVLRIETALAKASLSRVDKRDPYKLKHKMTRAQLKALAPRFDWDAYFKALGAPAFRALNVSEPEFLKQLNKQLETASLADWKTYLRWHVTHSAAPNLSAKFDAEDFGFYSRKLRGLESQPPRWKRCVRLTDQVLGEALGQLFVAKTFTADTRKRALDMNSEIQKAMEEDIKNLPWMSEETKKQALEKLHGMINKIGYPDKWRDYSAVKIARGDFIASLASAVASENAYQLAKIGKSVNRGEWRMTPPTVNAYYDPQTNDINFPAGVLQPPLFDPRMDDAPNYGNTGATIGHELTHGFDDEGRQFDAKGNLRDWWTKSDAGAFSTRAACVVDQYAKYTVVDDIKINSKLTLGEDLADLGGTILAYMAWKRVTAAQQLTPIDGYTPDQRFFIGFAQWACGDERPEQKRLRAATNPHSPGEYRINGVAVNMPEFGAAFACKPRQPMVKEEVCRVW